MVGNDVVDLLDPESDSATLHPGFDARVFASDELESIRASHDSARQRWRLWSAKESAYKLLRKLDSGIAFSPVKFSVELEAGGSGWVRFSSWHVRVLVREALDSIHALAFESDQSEAQLTHGSIRLEDPVSDPSQLSREVRKLAIARVADAYGFAPTELEIRRENRIPELWRAGRPSGLDLSLSHHGQCVGFACAPKAQAALTDDAFATFEAAEPRA